MKAIVVNNEWCRASKIEVAKEFWRKFRWLTQHHESISESGEIAKQLDLWVE